MQLNLNFIAIILLFSTTAIGGGIIPRRHNIEKKNKKLTVITFNKYGEKLKTIISEKGDEGNIIKNSLRNPSIKFLVFDTEERTMRIALGELTGPNGKKYYWQIEKIYRKK